MPANTPPSSRPSSSPKVVSVAPRRASASPTKPCSGASKNGRNFAKRVLLHRPRELVSLLTSTRNLETRAPRPTSSRAVRNSPPLPGPGPGLPSPALCRHHQRRGPRPRFAAQRLERVGGTLRSGRGLHQRQRSLAIGAAAPSPARRHPHSHARPESRDAPVHRSKRSASGAVEPAGPSTPRAPPPPPEVSCSRSVASSSSIARNHPTSNSRSRSPSAPSAEPNSSSNQIPVATAGQSLSSTVPWTSCKTARRRA
jgi:hypothetical protein